jgi:hypothetical protein
MKEGWGGGGGQGRGPWCLKERNVVVADRAAGFACVDFLKANK